VSAELDISLPRGNPAAALSTGLLVPDFRARRLDLSAPYLGVDATAL